MAHAENLPWVEVREDGVQPLGGILESVGTQRIDYREAERADCLVKIAQVTIRLGPAAAVDDISVLLDDSTFTCMCQTLKGTRESTPSSVPVRPIKGALLVQLRGIGPQQLVRIIIAAKGRVWRSSGNGGCCRYTG